MKLRDRGFVEIELDKTRHLKIDFRAARLVEKQLGYPLTKLSGENVGINEMVVLFWAGMAHEFKRHDWSIDAAEELMNEAESMQYVMSKIGEAIEAFFGDGKPKEKN